MTTEQREILIVDDNRVNVAILNEILEEYQLKCANNGATALKLVDEFKPDLVLLDIMMPDLNGYEVCQKIRQNPSIHQMISILSIVHRQIELKQNSRGMPVHDR